MREDRNMKRSAVAIPAVALASLLSGGLLGRRHIEQWRQNPDPLGGIPVRFPPSERRTVVMSDGAEIATWTAGSGPTIVLVHGLTASRHDWGPMAPLLIAAGYRIVAIDQRGHGDSTAGTAGYGSEQLGADLAEVFELLDLRARCLVGHSMGAMAAMGFAVRHSAVFEQRVQSLVAIASAGATNSKRQSLGLRIGARELPNALTGVDNERLRLIAGLSVFGKGPSLHMVDESTNAFRRCPESVRAPATAALGAHDLLDELGSIQVPSLVVGAGRDQLVRPKQVADLHAALPHSQLVTYPEAGHMVLWEHHVEVAEQIDWFAQSLVPSQQGSEQD